MMTPAQEKVFKKLQMALADCKKAGIHLIGSNESYYGLNKKRVLYERADCSGPIQDDEIVLSDIYPDTIRLCGCRSKK